MSRLRDDPRYNAWQGMKARCYNKNNSRYPYYGARGIYVCDRWLNDFNAFAADMGVKPRGCSIDRVDNNDGYHPLNCRWATRTEQMRNTRATKMLGSIALRDLAEISGVAHSTLEKRIARGVKFKDLFAKRVMSNEGAAKRAAKSARLTHCLRGHEYTPENTHTNSAGQRSCKECARALRLEYKKRDREAPPMRKRRSDSCKKGHPYTPENTRVAADNNRSCRLCAIEAERKYRAKKKLMLTSPE